VTPEACVRGREGGTRSVETATETRFGAMLSRAQETGRAVGAFTCYDFLGFEAVVRAAESYRAPVIVLVSPSSFRAAGVSCGPSEPRPKPPRSRSSCSSTTEPSEAEEFVKQSGVDCLAVAFGNVHGHYSGTPELDWGRLEEVRGRISASLSLHGASGLPEADLERAVSRGVAKFNVNTELRMAYFRRLGEDLSVKAATVNLKGLGDGVVEAVQEVVEAKLSAFGWTREEA
jgi:fructose/tagatose bisphosphate aldolase